MSDDDDDPLKFSRKVIVDGAEIQRELTALRADNEALHYSNARWMEKNIALRQRHEEAVWIITCLLQRELEAAVAHGFSDCNCMALSRAAEREYESGECPHQKARAFLAQEKP